MNIALLVVGIVVSLLVLLASVYFVVYFQHAEDKLTAWGPKLVVMAGISLAVYNVLLLPLSLANKETGGIPIGIISTVLLDVTLVFALFLIPFMVLYYEGIEEDSGRSALMRNACFSFGQFGYACKWMLPFVVLLLAVFLPLYFVFGYTKLPMVKLTGNFVAGTFSAFAFFCDDSRGAGLACSKVVSYYRIRISPFTYAIGIVDIFGWLLLSIFGGIGTVALVVDCMRKFRMKLLLLKRGEYQRKRRALSIKLSVLLEEHESLMRAKENPQSTSKSIRAMEKRFEKQVLEAEAEFLMLEQRNEERRLENSGLNKYLELLTALTSLLIYTVWTIQLVGYTIPKMFFKDPLFTFMNVVFVKVGKVPMLGTVLYGILAVWWIFFTLKGEWKVSETCAILSIYPIRMGETTMNSLLINTGIILACSVSIVHLTLVSFQQHAAFTQLSSLFVGEIQNIFPFRYAFQALVCTLVLVSPITAVLYLGSAVLQVRTANQKAAATVREQTARRIEKEVKSGQE